MTTPPQERGNPQALRALRLVALLGGLAALVTTFLFLQDGQIVAGLIMSAAATGLMAVGVRGLTGR
ncbi:MAG: hypothetical protein U0Q21_08780 [Dermatophilaceae bacterium]